MSSTFTTTAKADTTGKPKGRLAAKFRDSAPSTLVLWFLVVCFAFPLFWLILSSFKGADELFAVPLSFFPRRWTFSGYVSAWTSINFAQYFANTAVVAVLTTVFTIIVSAMTGYALAKYDYWWTRLFFIGILLTTMLPTEVIMSPSFLVVRDIGLYNTLAGIIVPSIITATGIFMFRQFFITVPDEMMQAARVDGCSELRIFTRVMLPISKPVIVTLAIFSFQWRWNDYIWPLLILNDSKKFTLQVALRSLVGAEKINWAVLLPASVISMVPLVLIFCFCQKYIVGADTDAGFKG
ncbi:carbohydrate ABC transporter permease [Bifidobacterium moukalabense]|uniref:carbohydrate ABC transporter permease n=1 Tax=Bifidobacterium moukalabense TaxID=1333651 RepID=UPI0010F569F9|nr:carbohydrate ABC transporter permease [Bifidobacterium moukalabense]